MKSWVNAVIAAALLTSPLVSFAQSSASVSRADVRSELVQVDKAGYAPAAEDASYPAKLQAAEARLAAVRVAQAQAEGYGSSTGASSQAGRANQRTDPQTVFFGQ